MYNKTQEVTIMANKILRLPDVIAYTGISRSSIYLYMERGSFPRQVKISERSVGWVYSEIQDWVALKIAESRPCEPG